MSETHVGLIGDLPAPTPVQRSKLAYALASIALGHSGQLVLHHGCGEGADEIAHPIVRILGGWQIHGHPAQADGDGSPHRRRTKSPMADVDVRHPIKLPAERDADIAKASTILIVAGPYHGDPVRPAKGGSGAANRAAGTAVREIIYLQHVGVHRKPGSQAAGTKHATAPAAATAGVKDVSSAIRQGRENGAKRTTARAAATAEIRDVSSAIRQGRADRRAGSQCENYKSFLKRYHVYRSEKAWEMWTAYYRSSRRRSTSTQRESPSPRKPTRPSRSSALGEARMARVQALQRKLNPPEAIRDAWR